MSAPRFLIDPAAVVGNQVSLTGTEAHHARRVLRLTPGDRITLLDGHGNRHLARVERLSPDRVETVILETRQDPPPRTRLHLCQGVLKGQKMELVCQKATELGVAAIWPFLSEHCAQHKEQGNRPERWQRISLEACKQCNRALPPEIHAVQSLPAMLSGLPEGGLRLLLWEGEQCQGLRSVFTDNPQPDHASVLIGPEGGFSDAEVNMARQAGFRVASLGRLTLRAETAALTALAILQYELGNLAPSKASSP